jgi:hypothetical protein
MIFLNVYKYKGLSFCGYDDRFESNSIRIENVVCNPFLNQLINKDNHE